MDRFFIDTVEDRTTEPLLEPCAQRGQQLIKSKRGRAVRTGGNREQFGKRDGIPASPRHKSSDLCPVAGSRQSPYEMTCPDRLVHRWRDDTCNNFRCHPISTTPTGRIDAQFDSEAAHARL